MTDWPMVAVTFGLMFTHAAAFAVGLVMGKWWRR